MVPVGAIDSRCELRMPCLRISLLMLCRQPRGEAAAGQVEVGVEQRERAALLRELDRRARRRASRMASEMRARHARAPRRCRSCRREHDQRVAQAGEAEADAALGHRFLVLLLERPGGDVEHVVEHADRRLDDLARSASKSNARLGCERIARRSASGRSSRGSSSRRAAAAARRTGWWPRSSRSSAGCCRG